MQYPPLSAGILTLAAGFAGVAEVLWTSQWGIPVSPDGLVYLSSAQSFANGDGFRIHPQPDGALLHHYPPLYPFLVGLLILSGLDLNTAPVLLNAVLFFLFPISLGWILYRLTGSAVIMVIAAWMAWLIPGFYPSFAFPWTEPIYLVTSLWGLYFLARYISGEGLHHLFAAGTLMGLAWLSRYAGASLWITGVISLSIFSSKPLETRMLSTAVFALLAGSPMGFWLIRNWILIGSPTDRIAEFHPPGAGRFFELVLTLQNWLAANAGGFPSYRSLWFSLIVVALVLWLWPGWKNNNEGEKPNPARGNLFGISLTVFFLGLFLSLYLESADPLTLVFRVMLGKDFSLYLLETLPVLITLAVLIFIFMENVSPNQAPYAPNLACLFSRLNILYGSVFLLLLLISMTWFDPFTRFLPRLLSPLLLVILILAFLFRGRLISINKTPATKSDSFQAVLPAAFLILLFSYTNQKIDWWQHAQGIGHGDLNREWRAGSYGPPSSMEGERTEIMSNFPVAYYLLTGQNVRFGSMNTPQAHSASSPILFAHLKLFGKNPEHFPSHNWQQLYNDDFIAWYRFQFPNPEQIPR